MEEKKKTTSTKKKSSGTKKSTTKKTTTKVAAKKTTTKKTTPKKATTKKTAPKKIEKVVEVKEEVPKIEEPTHVETKEEILEKTIIFDGKQKRNLKEVIDRLEEENVVVEDKIIKRSKVRKALIFITAVAMFLIASAALAYVLSQQKTERHYNETTGSNIYEKAKEKKIKQVDEEEVESKEKYEHIVTISLSQFETKAYNKENMVVLVASSSCSSCIQFEPDIEKVFSTLDEKIYRLDIKSMSDEEIDTFRDYFAFTVTPTIFIVKDGVIVADTAKTGRMTIDELTEWLNKNL